MAECTRCGATDVAVQTTLGTDAYCAPCDLVVNPPRWQDAVTWALGRTTTGMAAGEPVADVVENALRDSGFLVVHPASMLKDCPDRWTCCIHERPENS